MFSFSAQKWDGSELNHIYSTSRLFSKIQTECARSTLSRPRRDDLQTSHHCYDLEIFIWTWEADEPAALFTQRGNRRRISWSPDETGDVCEEQTSPRHAEGSEEDACQRPTQSCLITVATLGCCDVLSFLTHLFLERVQTATPHSFIMSPAAPRAPGATCALHATATNSLT